MPTETGRHNKPAFCRNTASFSQTEPGPIILTTKPDPDQNNLKVNACLCHQTEFGRQSRWHDGRNHKRPGHSSADRPFTFWVNNDIDFAQTGSIIGRASRTGARKFLSQRAPFTGIRLRPNSIPTRLGGISPGSGFAALPVLD